MPVKEIQGRTPTREEVEFSHVQGLMRLSVRTGGELRLPMREEQKVECTSGPGGFLNLPNALFQELVRRHNGTVECSGQQVPDPDPNP